MNGRSRLETAERAAPWIAGLALALPILLVRYPPTGDLAMHEALVAILRHRSDPSWAPPGLYYVVAPQANQLFSWLAYALSFIVPTDSACKLVVAASVFAATPAAARLLARLHRSPWLALLIGPVACGWMFRWGLVANLTGFVVLLLAVPSLERLALRPSGRALAPCLVATAVLFFAHESSAILFAIMAGVFAIVRGRSLVGVALRMGPALAVLALVLVQWRVSAGLASTHMDSIGTYYGADPMDRIAILPGAVFGGLGPMRLGIVGAVWVLALVASAIGKGRGRADRVRVACWQGRYFVLAALFFLLYLTFPMAIGGTTLLAHRFLPGTCACLVVACAARARSWPVVLFAMAAPIAMLVAEGQDFAKTDRSYRALDRLIALVPRNAAVAQLDLTPRTPGHVAPVPGAASRVQAERGGRMLFAMTDMPPNPVYVPTALQWREPTQRLARAPYAFVPELDLTRFGYVLAYDESPAMRPLVAQALAPEAEILASEGSWSLFRSRLPTEPLTSPDERVPGPVAETLAYRIDHLAPQSTPR
jgi:hypothetical protein